jgi:hypothetical protein
MLKNQNCLGRLRTKVKVVPLIMKKRQKVQIGKTIPNQSEDSSSSDNEESAKTINQKSKDIRGWVGSVQNIVLEKVGVTLTKARKPGLYIWRHKTISNYVYVGSSFEKNGLLGRTAKHINKCFDEKRWQKSDSLEPFQFGLW